MATELLSIKEAAKRGIDKLRLDRWRNPADHIKLDLLPGGEHGPWFHLYSPLNELLEQKNPQDILFTTMGDLDAPIWRPYMPQGNADAQS